MRSTAQGKESAEAPLSKESHDDLQKKVADAVQGGKAAKKAASLVKEGLSKPAVEPKKAKAKAKASEKAKAAPKPKLGKARFPVVNCAVNMFDCPHAHKHILNLQPGLSDWLVSETKSFQCWI